MKKYFAGLVAVTFAIVCFAFTSVKSTGPDCTTSNYWFHVKLGAAQTLCGAVTASNFDQVLDPNQNGVIDAGELDNVLVKDIPTNAPYGCPDTDTKICALSYTAAQITVVKNASNQWIFVPATPSSYRCCIKRLVD